MVIEHFNSHPHEEDDSTDQVNYKSGNISTHILTKRMTSRTRQVSNVCIDFNSHPHEEDDSNFKQK